MLPLLDKYGLQLGVQNHYGPTVCNAMGLHHLIERYDPRLIGAVWDAAHNASMARSRRWRSISFGRTCAWSTSRTLFGVEFNGPEAEDARWRPWWTTGPHGLASWPRVAAELERRNYSGVICLTAEYSDEPVVDRLIAQDIGYAKALFVGT